MVSGAKAEMGSPETEVITRPSHLHLSTYTRLHSRSSSYHVVSRCFGGCPFCCYLTARSPISYRAGSRSCTRGGPEVIQVLEISPRATLALSSTPKATPIPAMTIVFVPVLAAPIGTYGWKLTQVGPTTNLSCFELGPSFKF